MRVLLDTNVFIYREDDRVLADDIQKLVVALQTASADVLVHPLSTQEINKDQDAHRRSVMLSKIRAYRVLESPPNPIEDGKYVSIVRGEIPREKPIDDHDVIDNTILYAVYRDAVDFLITEDREMHRKAHRLSIDERVLSVIDSLRLLETFAPKQKLVSPPALREQYVHNLTLSDPFFDSLKKDYKEFDKWFKKISREGRKCFAYFEEGGSTGALLIYKIEEEAIASTPPLGKKKRLKLSTFKVKHEGHKIGELFIKLSIDIAIQNDIEEIYLTHYTETNDRLVDLISEYGFYRAAINGEGEDIFIKALRYSRAEISQLSPTEIASRFYPCFYDGNLVNKFVVPIRPEYHMRLFTDFPERQLTLSESAGEFIIEGNTIKKAYICHSRISIIRPGDLLLFYLSVRKKLTSLGIVESVFTGKHNSVTILKYVGKRSVYSLDEIVKMATKPTTIILFKHLFHLKKPLPIEELKTIGILTSSPQSIMQINNEGYASVKTEGGIDERFTVH